MASLEQTHYGTQCHFGEGTPSTLSENKVEKYLVATRIASPPSGEAKGGTDNLPNQTTYLAAS